MVRILIGASGSGKTYSIMKKLIRTQKNRKKLVIEREDYKEYSRIFSEEYITCITLKDTDQMEKIMDSDIYIDRPYYSEEDLEQIHELTSRARIHANNITITCTDISDFTKTAAGNSILRNAEQIFVGRCIADNECIIEKLSGKKLPVQKSNYDFRRIV